MSKWSADISRNMKVYKVWDHSAQLINGEVIIPPLAKDCVRKILSEKPNLMGCPPPWIYDKQSNTVKPDPDVLAKRLIELSIESIKKERQRLLFEDAKRNVLSDQNVPEDIKKIVKELKYALEP